MGIEGAPGKLRAGDSVPPCRKRNLEHPVQLTLRQLTDVSAYEQCPFTPCPLGVAGEHERDLGDENDVPAGHAFADMRRQKGLRVLVRFRIQQVDARERAGQPLVEAGECQISFRLADLHLKIEPRKAGAAGFVVPFPFCAGILVAGRVHEANRFPLKCITVHDVDLGVLIVEEWRNISVSPSHRIDAIDMKRGGPNRERESDSEVARRPHPLSATGMDECFSGFEDGVASILLLWSVS